MQRITKIRQASSGKTIFLLRKVFYNTPVMKWKLTAYTYDKVFSFGMPDLSKPIRFRNVDLFLDPLDRSYVPTVVGGYYEERELDLFDELSKLSTLMLDVGANVGMYSIIAAKNNPKIQCYAFEPVLENQELLKKNILHNGVSSQIKVVKHAASDKSGKAKIYLAKKLSGTHSLSVDHGGLSREVSTITIDEYCGRYNIKPDIIKIDVEGHEANVLRGMKNCLKFHPTILMEYIPQIHSDMTNVMADLSSAYKYFYVIDELSGEVKKMTLDGLHKSEMHNIIMTKNKTHIRAIEAHLTVKKKA